MCLPSICMHVLHALRWEVKEPLHLKAHAQSARREQILKIELPTCHSIHTTLSASSGFVGASWPKMKHFMPLSTFWSPANLFTGPFCAWSMFVVLFNPPVPRSVTMSSRCSRDVQVLSGILSHNYSLKPFQCTDL